MFIHGGYWQELSRETSRYPALPLHQSRIKTIVVGYDLCPAVTLPEIVDQILNAARFAFEYAEKMNSRCLTIYSQNNQSTAKPNKRFAEIDFDINP